VLELGWTEPLLVALLAATLLLARRGSPWLPLGLGAFLASKQFGALFLPLAPLLAGEARVGRRTLRLVAWSLLVALATVLPFLLWNPRALLRSTVLFHLAQPFRADSLSLAALWAWARGGVAPPTTIPTLVLAGLAVAWALRRARPTPAGFAAGGALVLLAALAWAKQVHCNYHDLIIGVLLCAVAAATPGAPGPEERTVP
jgi:hypothetical protein